MNKLNELELAACVGLDWADQRHVICLQVTGTAETESRPLEQKPDVLHDWVAQLRVRFQGRKVGIAIEQSRGAVIHALMMYDFLVLYPINPKALARTGKPSASAVPKMTHWMRNCYWTWYASIGVGCVSGSRIRLKPAGCRYWPNTGVNSSTIASATATGPPAC